MKPSDPLPPLADPMLALPRVYRGAFFLSYKYVRVSPGQPRRKISDQTASRNARIGTVSGNRGS